MGVLLAPGVGVGTPFAGWGDIAGEAGVIFAEPAFEAPAGGVGSAGLDAGTLSGVGCLSKILGTAIPCVSSAGSFLVTTTALFTVTNTVLFSTIGVTGSGGLFPIGCGFDFRELESPSEPDAPSSPCDSPSEELPRKLAVPDSSSGWSTMKGLFLKPSTLVVPVLGTSVKAIGTPNVLTGHGGGGVMKVASGLGCPEKIVVV